MFSLKTLRILALLFVVLLTQSQTGHLLAQTNTTHLVITKPLPFNKTISGQLRGKDDKVTFTFDIPVDQDIVFEYRTNKLVFSTYCIFTGESQPDDDHCSNYGGSGGDRPITSFDLIPTNGQEGQHATITLIRILDGASSYQITAHTITPQSIEMGKDVDGIASNDQSYQTYTIEADPRIPFTVEIEDQAVDGNFLWAVYQPFAYNPTTIPQQLILPIRIDGASGSNGASGINQLEVFYLGGNFFRILAQSSKNYKLFSSNIVLPNLSENQSANLSVNYRRPLLVTQLNIQPGETAQVDFNVTGGKGAIVRVYEEGSFIDKALSLGGTRSDGSTFALSGNVQRTAIKALYVVVQIPFDYTRDTVNVEVKWQRIT